MTDLLREVGTAAAAIWAGWQAWQAKRSASKADTQTRATGNGFAKHTTEALHRIEAKTDATHSLMVEHLADHAESDLRK